jgi:hypothetical protein
MQKKASTNYELGVISRFFPHVFSSFGYSFSSMKAYTNLHEATLTQRYYHVRATKKLFIS